MFWFFRNAVRKDPQEGCHTLVDSQVVYIPPSSPNGIVFTFNFLEHSIFQLAIRIVLTLGVGSGGACSNELGVHSTIFSE